MLTLPALAPGFDDPIALLCACHDKVRRFAALSLRVDEQVRRSGADAETMRAAADILRYFSVAAPLHHADEEEDLFPALHALGDPELSALVHSIEAEHDQLAMFWTPVRYWLEQLVQGLASPAPAELTDFARLYPEHANREEQQLYGAAVRLQPELLKAMGQRMAARRGTAWTSS